MKKISTKQAAKIRGYNKAKEKKEVELKKAGEWIDFFSGVPIPDYLNCHQVRWHHLKGRDGDLICDAKFIVPYIDENLHTGDYGYHNMTVEKRRQQVWYSGFLERLKRVDYDLWYNEVNKISKLI